MSVVRTWTVNAKLLEREGWWCTLHQDPGTKYVAIPAQVDPQGHRLIVDMLKNADEGYKDQFYDLFSISPWFSPQHIREEILATGDVPIYSHCIAPIDEVTISDKRFSDSLSITVAHFPVYRGMTGELIGYETEAEVTYNGNKTRTKTVLTFKDVIRNPK